MQICKISNGQRGGGQHFCPTLVGQFQTIKKVTNRKGELAILIT
jgi:hypothetical protein